LRIMFICLSNNLKDEFIYEAINYLLSEYFDNCGKKFRISKNSYLNAINKALTSRNPAVLVENILVSSAPFKEIAQIARESENDLWRKNQSLKTKIQQLESNELTLKDKLQEAAKENHSLNEQLSSKTRALEEWKAENKNLDQHWQELSKQKLTKQAGDTKRRIQNQITEIRLSLENQPPDTEIALLLLQRIEKILGEGELDGK
jgi:chromosome segregation ATPase